MRCPGLGVQGFREDNGRMGARQNVGCLQHCLQLYVLRTCAAEEWSVSAKCLNSVSPSRHVLES